jgi:SUKH-4 immunity protein
VSSSDVTAWPSERLALIGDDNARQFMSTGGLTADGVVVTDLFNPALDYDHTDGRVLLHLGTFDDDFGFYLDPSSGQVYFGMVGQDDPAPVNQTMPLFAESAALVAESFPFYADGAEPEECMMAAQRLAEALEEIDPTSQLNPDGFWNSFVHDVSIGDYYDGSL